MQVIIILLISFRVTIVSVYLLGFHCDVDEHHNAALPRLHEQ